MNKTCTWTHLYANQGKRTVKCYENSALLKAIHRTCIVVHVHMYNHITGTCNNKRCHWEITVNKLGWVILSMCTTAAKLKVKVIGRRCRAQMKYIVAYIQEREREKG